MFQGERFDRVSSGQPVSKARTHHAGENGDADSFSQIKFFDRRFLLFGRHHAFFRDAGQSCCGNSGKANANAHENDPA